MKKVMKWKFNLKTIHFVMEQTFMNFQETGKQLNDSKSC